MADSFAKKEREKKRRKRKQEKEEKKKQRKLEGNTGPEFVYVDENGNLTATPPDPAKKVKIKLEDIEVSIPKKTDTGQNDFTREGIVKFFNTEKGYGFIADKSSGDSYFVHVENINGEIKERDKVKFMIGSGPKGPIALDVYLLVDEPVVLPPTAEEEPEEPKTDAPESPNTEVEAAAEVGDKSNDSAD